MDTDNQATDSHATEQVENTHRIDVIKVSLNFVAPKPLGMSLSKV
jgi:hypothetical protein